MRTFKLIRSSQTTSNVTCGVPKESYRVVPPVLHHLLRGNVSGNRHIMLRPVAMKSSPESCREKKWIFWCERVENACRNTGRLEFTDRCQKFKKGYVWEHRHKPVCLRVSSHDVSMAYGREARCNARRNSPSCRNKFYKPLPSKCCSERTLRARFWPRVSG